MIWFTVSVLKRLQKKRRDIQFIWKLQSECLEVVVNSSELKWDPCCFYSPELNLHANPLSALAFSNPSSYSQFQGPPRPYSRLSKYQATQIYFQHIFSLAMIITSLRIFPRRVSSIPYSIAKPFCRYSSMAPAPIASSSSKASLSHEERTATEPRATDLHTVILSRISKVNERIQTYQFTIKEKGGIKVQCDLVFFARHHVHPVLSS